MSATAQLLIGDLFRRNARVVPGRVAASLASTAITHAALDEAANRIAWAVRDLGVEAGDRVLGWADTSLEVLALFAGLAKRGAVFAPLDARLGPDEALPTARLARPQLLVADPAHRDGAAAIASALGVRCVPLGRLAGGAEPDALLRPGARSDDFAAAGLREGDPHAIFFTSGSTGRPKGVVLSHRANYLRSFHGVFRDAPEVSVCMFPLYHMAGFTLALSAWQTRGEIALVESATAEAILDAVERRRASRLYCIPSIWSRILAIDTSRWDTATLRELDTGTSAVPLELIRALKQRFPETVTRIYYGSTEAGSVATLSDCDVLRKPGSVGAPSPGVEIALGEDGEIRVRSAYLMDGYFDDPEATTVALRGGWYHTGDLGELDGEGHLAIAGRVKDVIRTGGESVAPAEVEAALRLHPAVAEVAVVGVADPQWGEVVCAVVVPAAGAAPTLADLQECCEGRLAGFKKPRRLALVDALPRTPATGQIQRTLLVQQLAARSV